MSVLRLGLLQWRVGRSAGVAGFLARMNDRLAEAKRHGVELAVLPEYACMEAGADGEPPDVRRELDLVVSDASGLLDGMREAARRHRVWLAPGSLPMADGARIINRAPLIAPNGGIAFQDKSVMTRFEAESWGVEAGSPPSVFQTPWGLIGISICYDLEFPSLVRAQVEAGAWLILAPSCTDTMHGFNRVRLVARARALENQCFVAIAPTVGDAPWSATLDANRGYAAVYGPVDRGFPEDGVLARGALDAEQWVFADLDPTRLAAVRENGGVRNHRDWPPAPAACRVVAVE